MTTTREPRWDVDLAMGHEGERRVARVLGLLLNGSRLHVEVKQKRRRDDAFYVETEQNPFGRGWRPSGLSTSEAETWSFLVEGTGCMFTVPTGLLRELVAKGLGRDVEETAGDCPTRGSLLRVGQILSYAREATT